MNSHEMTLPFKEDFKLIDSAFDAADFFEKNKKEVQASVQKVMNALNLGELRIAFKNVDKWETLPSAKKAILLYFRLHQMSFSECAPFTFHDKIPLKTKIDLGGVRLVPGAVARFSSFIEKGAILMPSFVNVGAWVGAGTMVDTWATVGSCAQVGRNCHLSGGVGIGGVLEPPQASPVILEDNVFVGSRCIVVEGVHVEEGAVLGANVVLTSSTKIFDVTQSTVQEFKGRIPARSVVIPGTTEKKFPSGTFGVPCALIIGKRKPSTDEKTSLNETLRDFNVSV